jgi:hypothetical protein
MSQANNGHYNVKPYGNEVIETAEEAVIYFLRYPKYAKDWKFSLPFGHVMDEMRKINNGINAKDSTAFTASQRRGYWKIELSSIK